MNIKQGDKVKFVNEKGYGIVTKIFNSSKVMVAIEDGFEIPYLVSDLIKVTDEQNSSVFYKDISIPEAEAATGELSNEDYDDNSMSSSLKKSKLLSYEKSGAYLAFVPQNQRLLTSGNVDIFLINHTEAELLYAIYLHGNKGRYAGKSYGIVDSESKLLLETIEYNKLSIWSEGYMQLIYFNHRANRVTKPVDESFNIKSYKAFGAENYKLSPFFDDEKAVIVNLNFYNSQTEEKEGLLSKDAAENLAESMQTKHEKAEETKENFIEKYIKDKDFAEVDMHIWELVDDYSKLSPAEIFKIQISFFNKCLESALVNRLKKVVFIHGVGNGSLKKEIRSRIEADYPEFKVYDAPMAIYGIGATEINIPYNYKS